MSAISELRQDWLRQPQTPSQAWFIRHSQALQSMLSGFQALNWIDIDQIIRWVVPEDTNRGAVNADLSCHPTAGPALTAALKDGGFHVIPPVELLQGGIPNAAC